MYSELLFFLPTNLTGPLRTRRPWKWLVTTFYFLDFLIQKSAYVHSTIWYIVYILSNLIIRHQFFKCSNLTLLKLQIRFSANLWSSSWNNKEGQMHCFISISLFNKVFLLFDGMYRVSHQLVPTFDFDFWLFWLSY